MTPTVPSSTGSEQGSERPRTPVKRKRIIGLIIRVVILTTVVLTIGCVAPMTKTGNDEYPISEQDRELTERYEGHGEPDAGSQDGSQTEAEDESDSGSASDASDLANQGAEEEEGA